MTSSRFVIFGFMLAAAYSFPVSAGAQPAYVARLPQGWRVKAIHSDITIWEQTTNPTAHISAAVLPLPSSRARDPGRRAPATMESRSSIALEKLKPFLESRAAKMRKTGFPDWQTTQAEQLTLTGGFRALQLRGTFTGASGAPFCFVERQIDLSNQIIQLTATEKKRGSCAWVKMAEQLSKIVAR